jgi:hypothetical protein
MGASASGGLSATGVPSDTSIVRLFGRRRRRWPRPREGVLTSETDAPAGRRPVPAANATALAPAGAALSPRT